jgi:metal-responsive CopG/Arc/MetJ family transcriptional regulator
MERWWIEVPKPLLDKVQHYVGTHGYESAEEIIEESLRLRVLDFQRLDRLRQLVKL